MKKHEKGVKKEGSQLKSPGMTPRKLVYDFFNVNRNIVVHVKQSQARQTFVGHTRAKNAFDALQTTERSLSATRRYWESTQHRDQSFDVGVEIGDLRQSCSERRRKCSTAILSLHRLPSGVPAVKLAFKCRHTREIDLVQLSNFQYLVGHSGKTFFHQQ